MAAFAAVFLSASANASTAPKLSEREMYLTLKGKPTVTVVQETQLPPELYGFALRPDGGTVPGLGGDFGGDITEIGQIINLGKQLWDIIAANKPVVNVQMDTASALPQGATAWTDLQGWAVPSSRLYHFTYQNLFGMNVVDFSYRVLYSYGGNVRGKGKFLANVTVVPADLSVLWGYTFNAKASVPSVVNAGSMTDPVGAVQLLIDWKIDTIVKHEETSQNYYVTGDGTFKDLSNGN